MADSDTTEIDGIIQGTELKKSFFLNGKEIPVFSGLNFSFEKGKVIVITGRSGEGKSTLLGILGGLDRQTSGTVQFDGKALNDLTNEELAILRREKIGIIFQSFNLLTSWTAAENVEAVLMHTGVGPEDRRKKVEELLTELGLSDRLENLPSELSVGQQQRVAIARTLVNDPTVILADEPTGDVDPETAQEIIEMLLKPVRERGVTLIVATHGSFPLDVADKVFVLKDQAMTEKSQ